MYHFNGRTVQPFLTAAPDGYDKVDIEVADIDVALNAKSILLCYP